MKITAIETVRVEEHPNILWVRIETDEGHVGLGETFFLAQTVEEEVLLGLRFAVRPSARVLMGRLGLPLDRFGRRSPYRLSGGEQRRLSALRADRRHQQLRFR